MTYRFLGRFSLFQQWVTATVLAIIPLLIALGFAVISVQQQNHNQQLVRKNMEVVTSQGAAISELIKELVRLSRQYVLLKDPGFADLYIQRSKALNEALDILRPYLTSKKQSASINLMEETADKIVDSLASDEVTRSNVAASLQLLIGLNEELSSQIDRYRRQSLQNSEIEFKRITNRLFTLIISTFIGTLLLMVLGITLVSRPILRLSDAIKCLVQQHWDTPVNVHGPSDIVALGDNLEWMRKQILASDQQKAAFVQHMTHELKTPLAAIIEAGNLFDEEVSGPLTDKQRSILNVLRINATNLEHLIQQLLNYNAVSHGIVTQFENIQITQLVQTICDRIKTSEPDKPVKFVLSEGKDTIYTDARLLQMILINLLDNAFQFVSSDGIITVAWELNDHDWHLEISDNGPGIDPMLIKDIFTPFFSGENNKQRKIRKTGIGLAIVKECVDLLKGQIRVVSEINKGASFLMTFPLAK